MLRPLVLSVLLALPALPAGAEQLSRTFEPRTQAQARALGAGLALYNLRNHMRSGGSVRQWGRDNAAALRQEGGGNWGLVRQRGTGHGADLSQAGGNNAHAIIQGGEGAEAVVVQQGGEVGLTLQFGW